MCNLAESRIEVYTDFPFFFRKSQPSNNFIHILTRLNEYLDRQGLQQYPVHIKLDTGMHRLGFLPNETDKLNRKLQSYKTMIVQSV